MTISTTGSDSANIEQTIVNGTPPARSYSQTVGSVTLRIIEIGDDVYVDQGTGKFVKNAMPKATVDAMLQAFDPGSLLGAMKSQPELAFLENKGVEQKNGVSAVHMHADQNTPVPAGQSPVPAGAVIDIWIATEGNYLVALEASGMDTGSTVQSIQLEVTNINDPSLAITAPS
jgi:hypothetical protein